jgi:hypothetical protein
MIAGAVASGGNTGAIGSPLNVPISVTRVWEWKTLSSDR